MIRARACLLALGIAVVACDPDESAAPPDGVSCTETKVASDAAGLTAALASAPAGSCVVVQALELQGEFMVPDGVVLAGARDGHPSLVPTKDAPVVRIGKGSVVANLRIDARNVSRSGLLVEGPDAKVRNVEVTGSKGAGIEVHVASGVLELTDVAVEKNAAGLVATGGRILMRGGRAAENGGMSLASGYGIVAAGTADLELEGVTIEKNELVGLLVDGAQTRTSVKNAKVVDNGARGIWLQRVEGTLSAPSVRIEGTEVARNKLVGVGSFESRGIIIVGGRVGDTLAAPVVTNLSKTEQVGDGIGIFGGTSDFEIKDTTIEANARAAGVIDGSDRGIIIVGGKIGAGPSGLKFVVQNSTAEVQIADADLSAPPAVLGISAERIPVPGL